MAVTKWGTNTNSGNISDPRTDFARSLPQSGQQVHFLHCAILPALSVHSWSRVHTCSNNNTLLKTSRRRKLQMWHGDVVWMSVMSVCCTAVWAGGDGHRTEPVRSCPATVMRFRQQDFLISHKQDRAVYLILERIFTKCFIVIVFVSRSDYCSIVGLTI